MLPYCNKTSPDVPRKERKNRRNTAISALVDTQVQKLALIIVTGHFYIDAAQSSIEQWQL
jgi:hypothetical protein